MASLARLAPRRTTWCPPSSQAEQAEEQEEEADEADEADEAEALAAAHDLAILMQVQRGILNLPPAAYARHAERQRLRAALP